MPRLVLRPGAVTSFAVSLPATGSDPDGLRVWDLSAQHQSRDSTVIKWLRALQDRLPADWHADCLPRVGYGDFQVGYPENYYSVLTNELGWRIIARTNMIVGGPNGVFGGLTKQFELRPGGKAEQAEERNAAERPR